MNIHDYLCALPQFLVLIPTAASCYFPTKNQMKYSRRKTAVMCGAVLLPFSLLGALIVAMLKIDTNYVLMPFLIAAFILYRHTLKTDFPRALAVFIGVCAAQSFPAQFACSFDAHINPMSGAAQFSTEAAFFQLGLSVLMVLLALYPACKYGSQMVDRLDPPRIWYSIIALSSVFLIFNLLSVPLSYETLHIGRVSYLFPTLEVCALAILVFIYVLFYQGSIVILEHESLERRLQLLEMQSRHFRELQEYMRQTQRLRHDFRHSVHLLVSLAESGDLESIRAHLAEYEQRFSESVSANFCSNAALNALFGYYHEIACSEGIRTDWRIELPEPLTVSELDMAALFGNIMENAISACAAMTEGKRYFSLTSEIRHGSSLYVVSTNSFDGKVLKNKDGYLSTKHSGRGTGLLSIAAVAEKYNGSAQAHNSDKEFFIDVVIKI